MTGKFSRDLRSRRTLTLELPEFLLCALEARVAEANEDVPPAERSTLDHYIETELVNLLTVRDVAELDMTFPGFAEAIHEWLVELREP
ncbi:MAG TPA: hypothetical protein VEK57_17975 [Thermoanaerobaculia bacterium]|nr:hypothetical protein [Thermoanaerobaculia bacterium]